MIKKEAEKVIKCKRRIVEMWSTRTKRGSGNNGGNWKYLLRKYLSNVPGKHEIK